MLFVQNLGIEFQGETLFEGVSFRIGKGDRIGLSGKNGAGKSTLLKIISGKIKPTYGSISTEGKITVGYLEQTIETMQGKTVWEETRLAFERVLQLEREWKDILALLENYHNHATDKYEAALHRQEEILQELQQLGGFSLDADMETVLLGLGFQREDFHRDVCEFSLGWRMRIVLAKLLLQQHDILLLDEPTNHLDIESILWLEKFIANYAGAVVLVSHDRRFLDAVTNKTIEIANKSIQEYKGNYTKFLQERAIRRETLERAKKNQDQYIKHTEQLIDKFRAKNTKASFAKSLQKKLNRLELIELEDEDVTNFNIRFDVKQQPGKLIFQAEKLSKSYGEKKVLSDLDFIISRGEKIAFIGANGQGKTTLAKILAGVLKHEGSLTKGHNVSIGYFAQNQEEVLNGERTVLEEAEHAADADNIKRVRDMLGVFLFRGDDVTKKVKVLSGGERNRLALCKLLLRPFNVLIMDEPTNHLDWQSKAILKEALKNYNGTLILVSHDRDFLEGLSDRIFVFQNSKVKEFLGTVDEFLKTRAKTHLDEVDFKADKENVVKENQFSENKNNSFLSSKDEKKLKNKISKIESEISEIELKIKKLEEIFTSQNPSEQELMEYQKLLTELNEKMKLWEELHLNLL